MQTVTFTVPLALPVQRAEPTEPQAPRAPDLRRFIANHPAYRETAVPDERINFTMRVHPTPIGTTQIQRRCHELAGGVGEFLDLVDAVENLQTVVHQQVSALAWPGGRPEVASDEARTEQEQAFDTAYQHHTSRERSVLFELRGLSERIGFLALWPVLIVDPPKGWEHIDDKEIPASSVAWIRKAWLDAVEALGPGNV